MTIRNIDRFKADLDALVELAGKLELALLVQVHGKEELLEFLSKDGVTELMGWMPPPPSVVGCWSSAEEAP